MSKQEATNGFSKGLNMDLNPISTPNEILTDCLNGTIITYNGNEWNLQNDMGNYSFPGCELPDGFIPIGMKAYGDILYIISYNDNSKLSQIGTFPSPEYNGINGNIVKKYSPLQNYKKSGSDTYGDFIANLNMDLKHPIDIEIQESYDGSVNLIINDDKNEPRLINSGFAVREGGKYELIERNQYEQTNKYSEEKLNSQIKENEIIKTIKELPKDGKNDKIDMMTEILKKPKMYETIKQLQESGLLEKIEDMPTQKRKETINIVNNAVKNRNKYKIATKTPKTNGAKFSGNPTSIEYEER